MPTNYILMMFTQPKTSCLTIPQIRKLLRENHVKPSVQRIAICRYVLCEADHPTVEEVKTWADTNFPRMSLATVYNTLNLLARVGLVRQIRFPHMDRAVFDANMSPHYHLIDDESGQISDLPVQSVKIETDLTSTYKINQINLILNGVKR